eukprot:jgi/Psemu1/321744/estExt_fgenesh1_pg.C_90003
MQLGGGQHDDDDDDGMEGVAQTYGREALEQLMAEQKRSLPPPPPPVAAGDPANPRGNNAVDAGSNINVNVNINSNHQHRSPEEESFIPLEDKDDTDPYPAGGGSDDAPGKNSLESMFAVDRIGHSRLEESSRGWEQRIEQRAGIHASRTATTTTTSRSPSPSLLSLADLSRKLGSTLDTLRTQTEDLRHATNRRRVDREHAVSESRRQQEHIRTTGHACEFYQGTRRDLTLWVGALRDLNEKVEPIAAAFLEMLRTQIGEFGSEYRSWQDDCCAVLYETHRLDRILGRQPDEQRARSETMVCDEFGRDALDAALDDLDREYTSGARFKSIFDRWFVSYFEDYQQCYATLSFGDLYAVLLKVELFKSNFFPRMLLSLSSSPRSNNNEDRAISPPVRSALIELEQCLVCSTPKDSTESGESTESNKSVDEKKTRAENEGRIARSVEKSLLPMLEGILEGDDGSQTNGKISAGDGDPFGLFYSSTKSLLLSQLVADAMRHLPRGPNGGSSSSSLRQRLEKALSSAIQRALDGVAIPILKGNNDSQTNREKSDREDLSVRYACTYQAETLRQTLCNIIDHWLPLIALDDTDADTDAGTGTDTSSNGDPPENGIHAVLNFINDKYLMLLSSLENVHEHEATPEASSPPLSAKSLFEPVWEALHRDARNIVDSPSLMLVTMPLRAAALAYQL